MSKKETEIDKVKQANAFHSRGLNCAQSAACVFTNKTDLGEKTLFRVTEGLDLGMGCMNGACGAISAVAVLADLKCGTGHTDDPDSRTISCEAIVSCVHASKEKGGSLVYRELRGEDASTSLRSCPGCIENGVRTIQKHLFKED